MGLFFADVSSSHRKKLNIKKVLANEELDAGRLRQLAISQGGLLTNELRIEAWPKLLGVDVDDIEEKPGKSAIRFLSTKACINKKVIFVIINLCM